MILWCVLLPMKLGRLLLIFGSLGVMHESSVTFNVLYSDSLTVTSMNLHGQRNGQCVAAE